MEKIEEVREAVLRVVREEYEDGKDICTWAVLGVGITRVNV